MSLFKLYSQVMLVEDVPEQNLKKADVGTIVEALQDTNGSTGYAVEFFDAEGITVGVKMLDARQVGPLPIHSIMQVRAFEDICQ